MATIKKYADYVKEIKVNIIKDYESKKDHILSNDLDYLKSCVHNLITICAKQQEDIDALKAKVNIKPKKDNL